MSRFLTERKKLLVRATVWVLIGLGICMWGAYALAHMSSSRAMLAAFFAMLVGFDRSVLIELWYWTVDSKAAVVEQIQKLGLRVQGVEEPVGNGRSPYDRISMKWLGLAASALILRFAFARAALTDRNVKEPANLIRVLRLQRGESLNQPGRSGAHSQPEPREAPYDHFPAHR